MFAAAKELECENKWRAGVAAAEAEPERTVLFDVVRLGHGDPGTEKLDARDRPSSASPTSLTTPAPAPAPAPARRGNFRSRATYGAGYVWRDCMGGGVLVTAIIRSPCHRRRRVIVKGRSTLCCKSGKS